MELAYVMVDVGLKGGKKHTYENIDITEHAEKLDIKIQNQPESLINRCDINTDSRILFN